MKPDVSIIPERETVETPEREPLRKWQVAQLMQDQNGACKICLTRIAAGLFEDDHIIPLACGGTNALTNRQLLCRACHRAKTSGKDVPDAAKIKRMSGAKGPRARREKSGPTMKSRNDLGGPAYRRRKEDAERRKDQPQ